jgi:hypothetical protein
LQAQEQLDREPGPLDDGNGIPRLECGSQAHGTELEISEFRYEIASCWRRYSASGISNIWSMASIRAVRGDSMIHYWKQIHSHAITGDSLLICILGDRLLRSFLKPGLGLVCSARRPRSPKSAPDPALRYRSMRACGTHF